MQGHFWTNTIWYALLLVVTLAEIAVAVAKSNNRRFLIAYMMAATGLFYLFEYVLVALCGAYAYRPMLFPKDPFADTYAGNVLSQTSIAATCGLVASLGLKWGWYLPIAAAYFAVDMSFVQLGVYEEHWYKPYFTPVILAPLLWAMKRWHDKAARAPGRLDVLLLLFLGPMAATGTTVTMPMKTLGLYLYTGGFYADPSRDHTVTGTIFGVILLGLVVLAYLRKRWLEKAAVALLFFAMNWAAWQAGLIWFRQGWFVWVTLIEIVTYYAWVSLAGWLARGSSAHAAGVKDGFL